VNNLVKAGMKMDTLRAKMTAADASQLMKISLQNVHKNIKTKKLESFKSQNRVFFGFETAKVLFSVPFSKKVVSFQIVKGGTGKTSIAHSFAIRANLYGARVLCIDLDQQGNLTQAFSVSANDTPVMVDIIKQNIPFTDGIINISPGLDIFPSRIENAVLDNTLMVNRHPLDRVYANIINTVANSYDLIVIDCPPALGHSVAAATLASDIVIAPVTPEQFGLSGLKITSDEIKLLNAAHSKNAQMKIVLNKFDSRTALSNEVLMTLLNDDTFKAMMCQSFIRTSQEFPNTIFTGTNIYNTLKNTPAKEDIDLLVREILSIDEAYADRKKQRSE
jgi:chromosome partitioning protein